MTTHSGFAMLGAGSTLFCIGAIPFSDLAAI
jgi:hypothetical protein